MEGRLAGRWVQQAGKLMGKTSRVELLVVHRLPLPLEAGHLMLHPLNPYAEVVSRDQPPQ